MKSIFFFIFILISYIELSCVKGHKSISDCKPTSIQTVISRKNLFDKQVSIPIDTIEFIKYWEKFSRATLHHDDSLITLINDTVISDCPTTYNEGNDLPFGFGGKLTKLLFYKKIYGLFTEPYLKLLEKYDIKKDLFSQKGDDWQNAYRCEMSFDGKEYTAGILFDKDTVIYFMGYSIGNNYIIFKFKFKKTEHEEIKLFSLDCKSINISAG